MRHSTKYDALYGKTRCFQRVADLPEPPLAPAFPALHTLRSGALADVHALALRINTVHTPCKMQSRYTYFFAATLAFTAKSLYRTRRFDGTDQGSAERAHPSVSRCRQKSAHTIGRQSGDSAAPVAANSNDVNFIFDWTGRLGPERQRPSL